MTATNEAHMFMTAAQDKASDNLNLFELLEKLTVQIEHVEDLKEIQINRCDSWLKMPTAGTAFAQKVIAK